MNYDDLIILGISFGLGMLNGLQRQSEDDRIAGVRTFTLIAILGTLAGFLTRNLDNPFLIPFFGLAITAFLVMGNVIKLRKLDEAHIGQTTEVAALLMYAIGAYLVLGDRTIGVLMGGGMAILLYVKERLHGLIENLKAKELNAIMTFAGISLVVLPILPNETYGPFDVLNPYNIWLMVVLIVGISVVGYFIYKFVGTRVGIISNGILGGLISSTATTVSYSRKTKETADIGKMAAFIITAASAIALVRVLVEVSVVVPEKLGSLMTPILAEFVIMAGLCIGMFYLINKEQEQDEMPEPSNPAQFKSALIFGLLYALILLAVAFVKEEFGNNALYVVSIISGLTDVDAITLSLSQLMKKGSLEVESGWRLILLASLSNLMFKGIMAAVLGSRELTKWISITFGVSIAAGLLIMWLWPESWHFF
ncbi:MgtC/SapB family protein [Zeaxanthinibacter enoshimensis]|uniref:MgtC/SapB family protein n=1 Tax=Zeaxanthinibacter enoshimensis TaxID=392009 RepID=UPI003561AA6D